MQTLGRYSLHVELGRGGFATVYRATDTLLEREVAVKILKPGWTDDARAVERFMREAKQVSRLKHPNIVTIYDVGQADGRLFIAMELVAGRSLQQLIAEDGAMLWARVLVILEQSAAALDYAHKQNLIHRDIKPANIILDESDPKDVRAILTDFGLVRGAEQASLSMGTTGGLIGTPEYIAPEIWDGKPATTSSDIYALGCVAFYLLTGQVLFSGTTSVAVLKRHLEGPVFPAQWPTGVPANVEAVLRHSLAKEPSERPASAAEFVRELRDSEKGVTPDRGTASAAAEAERKRQAVERQTKEETERQALITSQQKAREEQERLRQIELSAQAASEKARRDWESEQAERQRLAAEAAALEKAKREAAEREQQHRPVEPEHRRFTPEPPRLEQARPATQVKSNRKWAYAAGGLVVVFIAVMVLTNIKPPAPPATPAPDIPVAPTPTKLASTQQAFQPTDVPQPSEAPLQATAAPPAVPFHALSKVAPDCSYGGSMKSIEAVDDLTVKFTLCTPDGAFLSKIAFATLGIQSAAHLQATSGKPLEAALGTGPYMLQEWVRGDHITLVANPYYWGAPPKVSTVTIVWNTDAAARLSSLQSGNIDGIDNPDPKAFTAIQSDPKLTLYTREALSTFYLGLNNTSQPFDNDIVRLAIATGIDRKAIVDKYYQPGSSVADYFTPCIIPGGCVGDPWYGFDPALAQKLLAEAGFPSGFKVTLSYRNLVRSYLPAPSDIAQDIQAQLKQNLNIDVTLDQQDSAPFFNNLSNGKLQLYLAGWIADFPDQTDFLDNNFGKVASDQFGNKFDDLTSVLVQAGSLADQTARNQLYAQANNLIKQHVPMVPIAHGGSATAWQAAVVNAHANPLYVERFAILSIPSRSDLVWMQTSEPGSLYCSDESDTDAWQVCGQIFDSLLSYAPDGATIQAGLATGCTPNADSTEWICNLRTGAKFSDGTPVTANDVVATYAVQWDAADPLHTGRDGTFGYWPVIFGGFLNPK